MDGSLGLTSLPTIRPDQGTTSRNARNLHHALSAERLTQRRPGGRGSQCR
jgi:hypothetical protein